MLVAYFDLLLQIAHSRVKCFRLAFMFAPAVLALGRSIVW